MTLSVSNIGRGAAPATGDLRKSDLVGEVIAFAVTDYDPKEAGQYGVQPRVDVDLIVCSGDRAGERDERWRTWGNLAAQMGEQDHGRTIVARVASGPGKTQGSTWYGLDFDTIGDAELMAARKAILEATARPGRTKTPPAEDKPPF
jgi:hypothetical protein